MRHGFSILLALFAVFTAAVAAPSPVLASPLASGGAAEPTPEPSAPPATIETDQDAGTDEAIAKRISDIFGELPSFELVTVEVKQGVVILTGTVKSREDIDRAASIVSRVEGVVTVENQLEREVTVSDQLDTLGTIQAKLTDLVRKLPQIALALLVAGVVAGFGFLLSRMRWFWRLITPNNFLAEIVAGAIRFFFIVAGLILALDMLQASALMSAVLGGAGVVGLALGFAMRDTVENYMASLLLSWRQPFRTHDHIVIEEYEGRVVRLTSRATILMTLDGNQLRIPNAMVFKAVILNYTRNPERRFRFDLGIDAGDDPDEARHLGLRALNELDFVLDKPEPQVRVEQVGDSNIVLSFFGWIDQRETDYYKARSRAIPAVKNVLEAAGFSLPEPIYRLRFDRDTAMPVEEMYRGEGGLRATPRHARLDPEEADTAPDQDIARMVEEEQAAEGGEQNLLDSRRPSE